MQVDDFDYELPPARIANVPAEPRDAARLLVYDRSTRAIVHAAFTDLPALLRAGDLLVRNDTRVRPWRLCGQRRSGGKVECLLLRLQGAAGAGYLKPSKKLRPGELLPLEGGRVRLLLRRDLGGGQW
ncbi:MAG TPA: S-adenosylmethionine:tRNA ribosyltransferase-isomerase, partial [Planctomycetota bacterium]|nr:S-adenosylmethionine:tRNA ribosyltransferase-isomerase [Planctomycetota bacterium]